MMRPSHLVQNLRVKISVLRWLICTAMLMALPALQAASVTLTWSPSPDPTVVGYNIYYGLASGVYTWSNNVGNVTNFTITNLAPDTTYYFAATSYDILGVESVYSPEFAVTTSEHANIAPLLSQNVGISGQFAFNVSGESNYLYVVQASTNLMDWVVMLTNAAPFTFVDTNAGQFGSRFYRVVTVPVQAGD